jgi:cardiolipin synthase
VSNLPNLITLARLLAVPVAVWLILNGLLMPAFWLFVAAGVSDAVDGYLAKRLHAETVLGKYLDPLADKALLVSVFISLGSGGYLQSWLVIMVVFRDALIVAGALLYHTLTHNLRLEPLWISKLNTAAQIVLVAVVLGQNGLHVQIEWMTQALVFLTAVTTFASGAAYVFEWTRRAATMEEGE